MDHDIRFDFSGKHVLVTGASRGIGYAIAEAFSMAGATTTILAENTEIDEAAQTLERQSGRPVRSIQCDITDRDAVSSALQKLDGLDILINNAGLEHITPISDTSPESIDLFARIIEINVLGTYLVTRSAIPLMQAGASIVQTCSIWSNTAVADFSAYCSSKHANLGFLRSMAAELAPRNIRVNGVCPGWVKTAASMNSLADMSRRTGAAQQALLQEVIDSQLLPGLMEPGDVAPAYLFLASSAAGNITGQTITVDRGSKSA